MKPTYQLEPFPKRRRLAPDIGWLTRNRYVISGALEVDVTLPRRLLRDHQARTGEKLSFTAFLTSCVGRAVDLDRHVHAMRNWKGDLVIFENVDISVLVERHEAGSAYPLAHIVRAANKKGLREISAEIRQAQAARPSDQEARGLSAVTSLPRFMRRLLMSLVSKNPQARKQLMGTVNLSAVGMFGKTAGWASAPNFHPLGLIVGSIVQKPGIVDGRIEIVEYLYLTLTFDHEVVDGAPAARFARCLVDLVETGFGIQETYPGERGVAFGSGTGPE